MVARVYSPRFVDRKFTNMVQKNCTLPDAVFLFNYFPEAGILDICL